MTEEAWVVNLVARHPSGGTDTEALVTHLLQQPSVGSYERLGWGPSTIDLSWRVHAPDEGEGEAEAKRSLGWLLGDEWVVEVSPGTKSLTVFRADQTRSGALDDWWAGLTAEQQAEALTLGHHAAMPEWMATGLADAGVAVVAGQWADSADAPTVFLLPRDVSEHLERRERGTPPD